MKQHSHHFFQQTTWKRQRLLSSSFIYYIYLQLQESVMSEQTSGILLCSLRLCNSCDHFFYTFFHLNVLCLDRLHRVPFVVTTMHSRSCIDNLTLLLIIHKKRKKQKRQQTNNDKAVFWKFIYFTLYCIRVLETHLAYKWNRL